MVNREEMNSNSSIAVGVVESMEGLILDETADSGKLRYTPGLYPQRPGEPDCAYFLRTKTCGFGRNCRYNHPQDTSGPLYGHGIRYILEFPERAGKPDCQYYMRTGACKYGAACKFNHPKSRQGDVWMNELGLPMRQDVEPCSFYMQTGSCKYGLACKFHHPQPSLPSVFYPALGTPALWSPATYLSCLPFQEQQAYMPIFVQPSQQQFIHMGNVWPSSAASAVTAPVSYHQRPEHDLPQQHYRPECRHFMSHEGCRYGPNCRYHHPNEKMLEIASSYEDLYSLTSFPRVGSSESSSQTTPLANTQDTNGTAPRNSGEPLAHSSVA